jgi:hypothetical protein
MSGKHFAADLRRLGACVEAIEWALEQPDAASAWAACERPDWLLWLAGRTATTEEHRKAIVLAGCACARTALKYIPEGEDRPRVAIETAEAWARGEATIAQVRAARDGAWAARGEFWRKWIDAAAADAADAAAYAARAKARREMADIVRQHITMPVVGMGT